MGNKVQLMSGDAAGLRDGDSCRLVKLGGGEAVELGSGTPT